MDCNWGWRESIRRLPVDNEPTSQGVLVVDDDAEMRKLISEVLASDHFRVHTAVDGKHAIEQTLALKPAMIILDLSMPKLNGVTFCKAIRRDREAGNTPIIVVTSDVKEERLEECIAAGADDFVVKPFDIKDLLVRVRAMMMSRHIPNLVERTQHYIVTLRALRDGTAPPAA
jgi:DNA-binding response OmpR family regulator